MLYIAWTAYTYFMDSKTLSIPEEKYFEMLHYFFNLKYGLIIIIQFLRQGFFV